MAMDFTDVLMLGLILVSGEHPARAGMSPGRSEPGGRGPRLETKVAFRYVPGMAHTGRPRLGLRVMTPAERVRRHRAKRARDAAALRLNQIVCGHAAEVMAGWPSKSIDLIITSPPYWDAVIYDGEMPPWPSYQAYLDDMQTVWVECARVLRPNGKLCINAMAMPIPQRLMRQETRVLKNIPGDIWHGIVTGTDLRFHEECVWQKQTSKLMLGAGQRPRPGNNIANNTTERITVYVKPGKPGKFPAPYNSRPGRSRSTATPIDPAVRNGRCGSRWFSPCAGRCCHSPMLDLHARLPPPGRLSRGWARGHYLAARLQRRLDQHGGWPLSGRRPARLPAPAAGGRGGAALLFLPATCTRN